MKLDDRQRATLLVGDLTAGDADRRRAVDALFPLVYRQLRHLARSYLARERVGHTLQPTALVHEAYLRLVDQNRVDWQGRTHFFAVGARAMRRVLTDHARQKAAAKRGGPAHRVPLFEKSLHPQPIDLDHVLAVDEALAKLGDLDARQAQVVELRFFGGLTVEEVAAVLGISRRSVEGDWTHARAWLERELSRGVSS